MSDSDRFGVVAVICMGFALNLFPLILVVALIVGAKP